MARPMIQVPSGKPIEIRPVIASIREDDAHAYYEHMVTPLTTVDVVQITVPRGVRGLLVQAESQNIRYTITDASNPSQTSGFILIAGNDPLLISVLMNQTIRFIAEAAGAILQLQYVQ